MAHTGHGAPHGRPAGRAGNPMEYQERIAQEILEARARSESYETEAHVSGLVRALALFMGTDASRAYLAGWGIAL